jgi:alpha-galactosidase
MTENEYSLFKKGILSPINGEIFFLQDPQTEQGIVIISETPDWISGRLSAPIVTDPDASSETVKISLENGGYPIVLGFCKRNECERLCRDYLRHANNCKRLITMSNTWGDRNGRSRICEEFILREIDAGGEIGIDAVQIDDGWQMGNTIIPIQRDENGAQIFYDGYWDINTERFPNGIKPLSALAEEKGMQLGLWFAPYSHDCFAKLERDKEIFRKAYESDGARFFKLDMYQVTSKAHTDRMVELLASIYSLGDDVSVQMDITRHSRLNYLCGREYGTIFVENRYLKGIYKYYPHRVLRNLWNISRYVPTNRFQFELINPDLDGADYPENDPFAPNLYDMDYLFASVMTSNPLFWLELQSLPEKRREELKTIMSVWKEHRSALASADIMPIGERPSGRSFTGFYAENKGNDYLLVFREVTDADTCVFRVPVVKGECQILASNGDVDIKVDNGAVTATFAKPRCYAFVKLK